MKVGKTNIHESFRVIGGKEIAGDIEVSGYKHAFTVLIAAGIISANAQTEISNIPLIKETAVLVRILKEIGGKPEISGHTLRFRPELIHNTKLTNELCSEIHGSVYLIPAMLARFGEVYFGHAGGDKIGDPSVNGDRSTEHILSILKCFGAEFRNTTYGIHGKSKKLIATEIDINEYSENKETNSGPFISGATKTAILAASVAEGTTIIKNPWDKEAAIELLSFIEKCGCKVRICQDRWEIVGGMKVNKVNHILISDSTEVMTYIACSAYMRNPLTITKVTSQRTKNALAPEISLLKDIGIKINFSGSKLAVTPQEELSGKEIIATSRGINTDSHPFFTLILTTANKTSSVTDHVWRYRFAYAEHLTKLGANLCRFGSTIRVIPRKPYIKNTIIKSADTRAGAVALIAALAINGTTTVTNIHHIWRGYENLDGKLRGIGATIEEI
jgi:UDP-N-acetylglucosamine 1-carboxyvinyltransferase